MTARSPQDLTRLLKAWGQGDQGALDELMPLVYKELYRLAKHYIIGQQPGQTLQPTALVHEAYLRLVDWKKVPWQNRAHFFGVSAQLMRRILVDFARARRCAKRGGEAHPVSLEQAAVVSRERGAELIALEDALCALATIDPRKVRAVELKFFGGLTVKETAEVLKVSPRTVMRELSLAQAWLYREMNIGGDKAHGQAC
jgi:RNA polymerase sigma-70 factor (ECF subfamily)